ncbi:MAG TPA: phosphoenolpyruvate-utilizing N-terminal domain-containing protein, partial [Dongiaceae bacterium]|nr:phosphoenolpyruvate-utilizing N-terminal domain-containing protein [Dongiaceae bacterium]
MKSDEKSPRRPRKKDRDAERVFDGLGVAPGIGIGQVHVVESGAITVSEYEIAEDKLDEEIERFHSAVQKSERQLRKLMGKAEELHGAAAEELGFLLDAHMQMLTGSRVTRGVEQRIRENKQNAESAVQAVISKVAHDFASLDDAYLAARASDVREVGNRILRNLTQTAFEAFKNLPAGSIVVAEELTPADTALLDPQKILGFTTVLGGKEGHTAIMARSLGLPAVLGIPDLLRFARTGQSIIVDGHAGRVILNPTPARIADYTQRQEERERDEKQLGRLRKLPSVTRDGQRIGLVANVELPREAEMAMVAGAEGIGLLRTEFMFMNRDDIPDEDEQYAALRQIVETMEGRPVTIRTLDV